MAENQIADVLGVKGATVVAGFAGAVVSLSFVKELSKTQMVVAVLVGSVTAAYLTPLLLASLHLPSELQNGGAFLIGLTAMNVIPGIIKLTELFRQDPWAAVGKLPFIGPFLSRFKTGG